jgi:Mn2+/Fe2+ NRAMP family transporter
MAFEPEAQVTALQLPSARWKLALATFGPGIVVMLADTDAGSVITAAQSGAAWGYRLLFLQILLVPILFIVQELTVRLGLVTGRGHGELIRERFGRTWAWLSVGTLALSALGALITELSGLAGVGLLFGVPAWLTMLLTVGLLVLVIWTGSYRSVERTAILLGAFEISFLWVAWHAHPQVGEILTGFVQVPLASAPFLYLAAANVGAVIMPWMVFYQQSAVVDKGLNPTHLKAARWDTALGALVTQAIMAAVLIATAATIGRAHPQGSLSTIQQIADALTPFLGTEVGRTFFALGMSGAALVATIVVTLAAAWGLGEVTGYRRSLQDCPSNAPWFYGIFTVSLVLGGLFVASGINLVALSVAVEVMNAMLLPLVLGFLFLLALKALPEPYRLSGFYACVVGLVVAATAGFGIYAALSAVLG